MSKVKKIISVLFLFIFCFGYSENVLSQNESISLKPNPAKTFFRIELDSSLDAKDAKVAIFDIIANPIKNYTVKLTSSNVIEVNIESLSSGMYIVQIQSANFTTVRKRLIVDKN